MQHLSVRNLHMPGRMRQRGQRSCKWPFISIQFCRILPDMTPRARNTWRRRNSLRFCILSRSLGQDLISRRNDSGRTVVVESRWRGRGWVVGYAKSLNGPETVRPSSRHEGTAPDANLRRKIGRESRGKKLNRRFRSREIARGSLDIRGRRKGLSDVRR